MVAKFNKNGRFKGQFLAAGRLDGMVVLWDFSIRGPIQVLEGHVKPIVSLSWSRRGRFLLSASKDWTVIVWDLKTGERRRTVRFDAPVTCAALHSKNRSASSAGLRWPHNSQVLSSFPRTYLPPLQKQQDYGCDVAKSGRNEVVRLERRTRRHLGSHDVSPLPRPRLNSPVQPEEVRASLFPSARLLSNPLNRPPGKWPASFALRPNTTSALSPPVQAMCTPLT